MKTRVITGVFFTLVILLFVLPAQRFPWLVLLLFAFVNLLGGHELYQVTKKRFHLPLQVLSVPYRFFFLLPLIAQHPMQGLGYFALVSLLYSLVICILACLRYGVEVLPQVALTAGLGLYLAFPSSFVSLFQQLEGGYVWFLIALFSPWVSDVFAYLAGSTLGKHKLIPKLSPKKTVEGFFGGILGTVLAAFLAFFWMFRADFSAHPLRMTLFLLCAAPLLSLMSQLGDWLASAIKRCFAIKDYGHLLPGHGGIMDRFDSVLFTLPTTFILAWIYPYIVR